MPITDNSYFSIFTSGLTFYYRVKKLFYGFSYPSKYECIS